MNLVAHSTAAEYVAAESESPTSVLRRAGRTFHSAKLFLGRTHAERSARLYAFCRYVDDIADGATADRITAARAQLYAISRDLQLGRSEDPRVADLLQLRATTGLSLRAARELVAGVSSDTSQVRVQTEAELLRYCYQVAGTVGLMMCGVLDARSAGTDYAIDLGIAMQLTNIARDVAEDAALGRRYLPGEWLGNLEPAAILHGGADAERNTTEAIRHTLALAENYYASGLRGLAYLPARPALAIEIAARSYREIGRRLLRRGIAYRAGRAVVATRSKLRIALRCVLCFPFMRLLHRRRAHRPQLHTTLFTHQGNHGIAR